MGSIQGYVERPHIVKNVWMMRLELVTRLILRGSSSVPIWHELLRLWLGVHSFIHPEYVFGRERGGLPPTEYWEGKGGEYGDSLQSGGETRDLN